jgi:hypothetical protein
MLETGTGQQVAQIHDRYMMMMMIMMIMLLAMKEGFPDRKAQS